MRRIRYCVMAPPLSAGRNHRSEMVAFVATRAMGLRTMLGLVAHKACTTPCGQNRTFANDRHADKRQTP